MHPIGEHAVVVNRPIAVVYAFTTDLTHFGDWFPQVVAMTSSDDRPPATVGKLYHETVRAAGNTTHEIRVRVVEAQTPVRLVTEGDLAPLLPRMELGFEQAEGGDACRVTWRMFSRAPDADDTALALARVRAVMQQRAEIGLAQLKQRLEGPLTA